MAASAVEPSREDRLRNSRAQFLSSLTVRLRALHEALTTLSAEGHSPGQHGVLLRRLAAMADAARMLGYDEMANAFAVCGEVLSDEGDGHVQEAAVHEVRSLLDLVPSLIPDIAGEEAPASGVEEELPDCGPLNLVCMISAGQSVLLRRAIGHAESVKMSVGGSLQETASLVATYEPDWVVVDGRRADAAEAVARFRNRSVLVIDATEHATSRLRSAGAKFVAVEGTPLRRTVTEALRGAALRRSEIVPKADVGTIARVVESAAQELRESLLVGLSPHETQQLLTPSTQSALEALTWSAISKMRELITEASGGAIQYPEHAPEGALLVTGKAALRHSRHPGADTSNLKGRRVVVADDDPAITWFLGSVLRAAGAEVLEARDGLEALRLARRELPDLVISDVMMPELDGFALCRNLKRDVLLSDVPVILLSWKEDLLQRVRELGVGAAGYLPKETEATVIVERCCEAIEPRVRIERRLRDGEIVHGRLDGITPRLVLDLACRTLDNACVTFQDAAFSYEVCVGDGRILTATRGSKETPIERGSAVLSGLLGMRAGRFVVEPTRQAVQAELFGSLAKIIAPHVERIRRALGQLQGTRVYEVQRLDLDYPAIAPYLASSPTIMSKLVERLVQGVAPSSLLQQVSASLLESVLVDLALRGVVLAAWDANGEDLLIGDHAPAEAFDVDLGTPRPGAVVQPAPGAPKIDAHSTAGDAERAAAFAERAIIITGPAQDADVADAAPRVLGELELGDAGPEVQEEETVTPDLGGSLLTREQRHAGAGRFRESESLLAEAWAESGDGAAAVELFESVLHATTASPVLGDAVSIAPGDVASVSPGDVVRVAPVEPAAMVHINPPAVLAQRVQARPTLAGLGFPSPPRTLDWREFIGDPESESEPVRVTESDEGDAVDALDALFGESPTSALRRAPVRGPAATIEDTPLSGGVPARVVAAPFGTSFEHPVVARGTASAPIDLVTRRSEVPDSETSPTEARVESPSVRVPEAEPVATDRATEDPHKTRPPIGASAREAEAAAQVAGSATTRAAHWARRLLPAAVVLGTGGVVFGLSSVGWRLLGDAGRGPTVAGEVQSPAGIAQHQGALEPGQKPAGNSGLGAEEEDDLATPGQVTGAPALVALRSVSLPLPENIQVAADNGLLEVSSDGRHKIYVNNVFVGRGPLRRVPLKAGAYTVTLRLDGAEQAYPAEVALGKRTRLEPAP